ncbi:hypothetical protein NDU88_007198 [Pleurodeles waltl]|uniref:Uncharacterized protein n=1 Tax=Pleurodeles waltl TaxID=8319 RepID=A0AAV7VSV8_PLEWA|nr:hypothetical protein NDU88_007198 [Pleurodeles waltl]
MRLALYLLLRFKIVGEACATLAASMRMVIREMACNKTPEVDGLSMKFYTPFVTRLVPWPEKLYRAALDISELPTASASPRVPARSARAGPAVTRQGADVSDTSVHGLEQHRPPTAPCQLQEKEALRIRTRRAPRAHVTGWGTGDESSRGSRTKKRVTASEETVPGIARADLAPGQGETETELVTEGPAVAGRNGGGNVS